MCDDLKDDAFAKYLPCACSAEAEGADLVVLINAAGGRGFGFRCRTCGKVSGGKQIPSRMLCGGPHLKDLPQIDLSRQRDAEHAAWLEQARVGREQRDMAEGEQDAEWCTRWLPEGARKRVVCDWCLTHCSACGCEFFEPREPKRAKAQRCMPCQAAHKATLERGYYLRRCNERRARVAA